VFIKKKYCLVIVECAPQSAEVVLVSFSFCVNFGREEKPGAKHKANANMMYFKKPFRIDSYKYHLEVQHPEYWKQYQSTSDALKKTYFQDRAPAVSFQNRITAHLPGIQVQTHHTVRKGIMDITIGEMYFEPKKEDNTNLMDTGKEKALLIFKEVEDIPGMYCIVIKYPILFSLIVDNLSVGLLFRAVAKVILMTKELMGMASIGIVSIGIVITITQDVFSLSLELISNLLMKCRTFSLAMDMSTHMSTSYLGK
jgi:hypothetical protein